MSDMGTVRPVHFEHVEHRHVEIIENQGCGEMGCQLGASLDGRNGARAVSFVADRE
jgi:hypothetical protein